MTKIGGNKTFTAPFAQYGGVALADGGWQRMNYRNADHCPDAKRPTDIVQSMLNVNATRFMPNDKSPTSGHTIGISFEEITTTRGKNGKPDRTAGRVISHEFPIMEALKLAEFILECAMANPDARDGVRVIAAKLNQSGYAS